MWIEVQRKNKKIPSPTSSPKLAMDKQYSQPYSAIQQTSSSVGRPKRIRPPPGFPELDENAYFSKRPCNTGFWTDKNQNDNINWRDDNVS